MSHDPDSILKTAEASMTKAQEYLEQEFRGVRAGRASAGLVEHVKVEAYGAMTELKGVAAVNVPEPTQLLIKPFDPQLAGAIKKAIEEAGMGLNPQIEDKQVRVSIPTMSSDRRKELVAQVKKMGEEQKVSMRNARRDANKQADALLKDKTQNYPEDEIKQLHDEIQELLKSYEAKVEAAVASKSKEITEI